MNYQQALGYILSFTDFERAPGVVYSAANFDLRRMEELLGQVGNPQLGPRSVLVAGTKGKGSTAAMIASALGAASHRTGFYTSPHLHTFRERIAVNGEMIPAQEMASIVARLKPVVEAVNRRDAYGQLTTFEILTTIAFIYFRERGVEFQVLEVGLGGRLDATNMVTPEVAVITSISFDHAEVLGNTLSQIAGEKAGIIKPGSTAVISPQREEAEKVIADACRRQGARLIAVGRDVTWERTSADMEGQSLRVKGLCASYELAIPLIGDHQLENAATAVAALEVLEVPAQSIAQGLKQVRWPGRLEILGQEPLFLVDGAHNADSARRMRQAIEQLFRFQRLILIIGVSWGKDIAGIAAELAPVSSLTIATRSRNPRALEPSLVLEELERHGMRAEVAPSVAQAAGRALELAAPNDLICATGSLFIAAEAREFVKGIAPELYPLS